MYALKTKRRSRCRAGISNRGLTEELVYTLHLSGTVFDPIEGASLEECLEKANKVLDDTDLEIHEWWSHPY